jgi:hypothetical protein
LSFKLYTVDCKNPANETLLLEFDEPSVVIEIDTVRDGYLYFQRATYYDRNGNYEYGNYELRYYKVTIVAPAEITEISKDEYPID